MLLNPIDQKENATRATLCWTFLHIDHEQGHKLFANYQLGMIGCCCMGYRILIIMGDQAIMLIVGH